jgi:hypothetical protein
MSKMSEDDLLAFLRAEQDAAWEFSDGALAQAREQAMRAYLREPYGNEEEGRSAVIASDTFDAIEGMLPDLVEVFVSSDKAVVFDPVGPEDEEGAKQATDACNYVFYKQNNGFLTLYTAAKDALMLRTGGVKWCWEVKRTPDFATYRGVSEIQLAVHLATHPDAEVIGREDYEPTEQEQQQRQQLEQQAAAAGQALPPEPPRFTVKIKTVKQKGRVRIMPIPPQELQVSRRHNSVLLDECPYVAHVTEKTLSDLIQMGLDVDEDDVKASQTDRRAEEDRRSWLELRRDEQSRDPSMTRGWLREEYVLCDYDGDGIAERRRILRLGQKVLENEEVSHVPIAAWTPYILQHRFSGISVADLVEDFQRISTEILRAQLDNLALANNQETVVTTNPQGTPLANIDDLLNRRPGGIIREQQPGAVRPYVERWQGIEAMPMVEMLQSAKENRTGYTRYSQGLDADSLNKTAHGMQQIMNASQKRMKLMARIMAEALVAPMFRGIFKTLTDYCMEALSFRLNGRFVQYDPQSWRDQYDMTINVGIGTGDVQQQAAMLQQIAQAQAFWLQTPMGAQLVKPQHVHAVQARIAENAGFKNPGEFWSDPNSEPPPQMPPPPPDPKIVTTQMQLQADAQKTQATMQTDAQKFQAQLAFDAQQAQLDRESKERIELARLQVQAATKQAEIASQQQPDMMGVLQPLAEQIQALANGMRLLEQRLGISQG